MCWPSLSLCPQAQILSVSENGARLPHLGNKGTTDCRNSGPQCLSQHRSRWPQGQAPTVPSPRATPAMPAAYTHGTFILFVPGSPALCCRAGQVTPLLHHGFISTQLQSMMDECHKVRTTQKELSSSPFLTSYQCLLRGHANGCAHILPDAAPFRGHAHHPWDNHSRRSTLMEISLL